MLRLAGKTPHAAETILLGGVGLWCKRFVHHFGSDGARAVRRQVRARCPRLWDSPCEPVAKPSPLVRGVDGFVLGATLGWPI